MGMGDVRAFVKHNVLSTSEVAEKIGVTRQRVNMLCRENELLPVKVTSSGSLFLFADVEEYIRKKKKVQQAPIFVPPFLSDFSGKSPQGVNFCLDNLDKLGEIQSIFIFFDNIDAVLNNFYLPSEQFRYGELRYLQTPSFILRDFEGKEMWLSGCNAGYGGGGPHGSKKILNSLDKYGFSKYSNEVFNYKIIKLFRDTEGNIDPVFIDEESVKSVSRLNDNATLYFWRGNPILIQKEEYRGSESLALLERYKAFIPNPVQYIYFPDDDSAKESGYFAPGYFNDIIYRLIIIDSSGRQIWLNPLLLDKDPFSQNVIQLVLESCGFDIPEEENVPQTILSWLKTNVRRILPAELKRWVK